MKKLQFNPQDVKAETAAFKPVPEAEAEMAQMHRLVVARFALLYAVADAVYLLVERIGDREGAAKIAHLQREVTDAERAMNG